MQSLLTLGLQFIHPDACFSFGEPHTHTTSAGRRLNNLPAVALWGHTRSEPAYSQENKRNEQKLSARKAAPHR